ncbi:MAG: hypothetical protein FWG71_01280 [Synergistaceae bacterium]|nr:hypothetical protein [Synergistaceae bacterium]
MYAIKGIYDGNCFRLEQPIPVKEEYKVVIAFTDPVRSSQESILDYCGAWDDLDAKSVNGVIAERESFSFGRIEG